MAGKHQTPCTEHIKLRVKTEKELALLGQAIEHNVKGMVEASATMAGCVDQMQDAVKLMTRGRIELARQDERLKAGNEKFRTHGAMILGLCVAHFATLITIVAIHGPAALKYLKLNF